MVISCVYFYFMLQSKEFIVVGAGPVGLSIAMLLKEQGYLVTIYEKRSDPRLNPEHGRSINLALSHRGFKTLALLGLENKIKTLLAIPMHGRLVHDLEGNTQLQPYSSDGKAIYSVSRAGLNNLLVTEAENKGLEIIFNSKCNGYDPAIKQLHFEGFSIAAEHKSIIACDGAFSPLRNSLKALPGFSHTEKKLEYGYKEFTIQSDASIWKIEKNALHIWPRKDFMLIALPNIDGSFTCTLFLRLKGEQSFERLNTPETAKEFFTHYFKDALPLMESFEEDLELNPVSNIFMETCFPWNLEDNVLLLGDAAHAIVPFYGQGLNAGLEDVSLLMEEIKNSETSNAFNSFPQNRKKDTDAIGELALQNFIEMRDLVTDETFLLKKKLESKIKKLYPDKWKTQYELVTFSDLPYSKAQTNGIENDKKLSVVLKNTQLTKHLLEETLTEQDMHSLSVIIL